MSQIFRLLSIPFTAILSAVLSKGVSSAWHKATGNQPPTASDPEVKIAQLLLFEILIAAAAVTVQVLSSQLLKKYQPSIKAK